MIKLINKKISNFKKNLFSSNKKECADSSRENNSNNKGQVAIILILMTAVALIFYAVTLNLGRVSNAKTLTIIAAEKGASLLASQMASYAQKLVKENLQGQLRLCSKTSVFSAIISFIIVVIVAVIAIILAPVTSGGSAKGAIIFMSVLAIGFAAASVVLQITVVQPGITDMWNKVIGKTMSIKDQFVESGVRTALQGAVTDSEKFADVFDMDTDRVYGFTGDVPNDTVSRFGFYYTIRLDQIKAPDTTEIDVFRRALDDFMHGDCLYMPGCNVDNNGDGEPDVDKAWGLSDPVYVRGACVGESTEACTTCPTNPVSEANPCCLPDATLSPLSGSSLDIRPDDCAAGAGCPGAGDCSTQALSPYAAVNPVTTTNYKWVFDKQFQDNYNNHPIAPSGVNRRCLAPTNAEDCCGNGVCERLTPAEVGVADEVWENHRINNEGSALDDDEATVDVAGTPLSWYCPEDCFLSLKEQIGLDDEHELYYKNPADRSQMTQLPSAVREYLKEDATGFFDTDPTHNNDRRKGVHPLFWRMIEWGWDLTRENSALPIDCYWNADPACGGVLLTDHVERINNALTLTLDPTVAPIAVDTNWFVPHSALSVAGAPPIAPDRITLPGNIIASEGECAQDAFDFANRGFWKSGAPQFCSNGDTVGGEEWPYYAGCAKSGPQGVCRCWKLDDDGVSWVDCEAADDLNLDGDNDPLTIPCPQCSELCQTINPDDGSLRDCDAANGDFDSDGDGDITTVPADCGCGDDGTPNPGNALAEVNWRDDVIDDILLSMDEFLAKGVEILEKTSNNAAVNFDDWYADISQWIEPGGGATRSSTPMCYYCEGYWGVLWQHRDAFEAMRDRLMAFRDQAFTAQINAAGGTNCGDVWCVPNIADLAGDCDTFDGINEERNKEVATFNVNGNGSVGDMEDIVACLDYNVNDERELQAIDLLDIDGDGNTWEYHTVWDYTSHVSNPAPDDPGIATGNAQKFDGCLNYCNYANCNSLPRSLIPGFDGVPFVDSNNALLLSIQDCLDTLGDDLVPPSPDPDDPDMSVADCQTSCGALMASYPLLLNPPYNLPAWNDPNITWIPQCNAECSQWCGAGDATGFFAAVNTAATTHADPAERAQYVACRDSVGAGAAGCRAFCDAASINHPALGAYGWTAPMSNFPDDLPQVNAPAAANVGSCSFWYDGATDYNGGGAVDFRAGLQAAIVPAGGSCSDVAPGGFLDLVTQSRDEAINQVSKFQTRLTFLENRLPELQEAIDVFETARRKYTDFLEGPAQDIIRYKESHEDGSDSGLPNHAIYMWQSPPPDPTNPTVLGAWHIVRSDVRTPGRCMGRCNTAQTGPQAWPSIKTETNSWGTKRCYFIIDYVGTVKARVTRVDEDTSNVGRALFPNGVPIWDFRFNHPLRPQTGSDFSFLPLGRVCSSGPGSSTCPDGACEWDEDSGSCWEDCPLCPDGNCAGGEDAATCPADCDPTYSTFGDYCGDGDCESGENQYNCPKDCGYVSSCCGNLMADNPTVAASPVDDGEVPQAYVNTYPNMGGAPAVRKIYSGALMLNEPITDGSSEDNSECWLHVNRLLTRGASSEACARYYWEGTGFTHRFVDCEDW